MRNEYYGGRSDYVSRTRRGDTLSLRVYNVVIGVVLLWGFVCNALMHHYFADVFASWNIWAVIIGYFVCAFIGIFMSTKSDSPVISFIGYNLVVVPVGVVLSLILRDYDSITIMHTIYITAVVTIIMIVLAIIFPRFFLSLGRVLFFSLLAVIIVECIAILLGFSMPSIWDLVVAGIFCLYIGYDWAEAQEKRKTLNNAIDSVVGLYLDIINLFVRLLGSKDDD